MDDLHNGLHPDGRRRQGDAGDGGAPGHGGQHHGGGAAQAPLPAGHAEAEGRRQRRRRRQPAGQAGEAMDKLDATLAD